MFARRIATIAPLVLALSAGCAQAGVFDGDAMAAVAKLRQDHDLRLENLDQAARNQLEVGNQVDLLKSELATLRGQLEQVTYELSQAQKRLQDYYLDLDNRLRKQEEARKAADEAQKAAPAAPDPEVETKEFEAGLTLFKGAQYKEAAQALRGYLSHYPAGRFAPNACYWGGNAHFQLKEWNQAVELYGQLSQKWPSDPKASDAMLQMADAQKQAGATKASQSTLEELVARYPGTAAATAAKQRLPKKGR